MYLVIPHDIEMKLMVFCIDSIMVDICTIKSFSCSFLNNTKLTKLIQLNKPIGGVSRKMTVENILTLLYIIGRLNDLKV